MLISPKNITDTCLKINLQLSFFAYLSKPLPFISRFSCQFWKHAKIGNFVMLPKSSIKKLCLGTGSSQGGLLYGTLFSFGSWTSCPPSPWIHHWSSHVSSCAREQWAYYVVVSLVWAVSILCCCVTCVNVVSRVWVLCHVCECCVTCMSVVSLVWVLCHLCECCVTYVSVVSLVWVLFTYVSVVSLVWVLCHLCECCVTYVSVVSLMWVLCHLCECFMSTHTVYLRTVDIVRII